MQSVSQYVQPMTGIDDTDFAILALLLEDGRISVSELSERVHISRSVAYERVQRLRSSGVIRGFTARLDNRRLGLDLTAFVTLATEQAAWDSVNAALHEMPEVEYAAATAGTFDAIVLVRVRTLEELKRVVLDRIHTITGVRSTTTIVVLDEIVKRVSVLPNRGGAEGT